MQDTDQDNAVAPSILGEAELRLARRSTCKLVSVTFSQRQGEAEEAWGAHRKASHPQGFFCSRFRGD